MIALYLTFLALGGISVTIHDLNPYIRLAMPSLLPFGLILNRRIIFDYELIYIERGSISLM